jgi:hypothetical protein
MRYSPTKEDDKWLQYDNTRIENQFKTITDLQNQIDEYKKRERAFMIHIHLKEKQISLDKKEIKEMTKKYYQKIYDSRKEINLDTLLFNEFKILKTHLKDKEEKIIAKDEELLSLQTVQNK